MSTVSNLTDLMLRVGDARAAGILGRAQAFTPAITSLGQLASNVQQAQRAQEDRARQIAEQAQIGKLRDAQIAQINQGMDFASRDQAEQDKARTEARHAQAIGNWLTSITAAPPDAQAGIYAQGRSALAQAGVLDQQDLATIPEQFQGPTWVKGQMARLMPAVERYKALFPEEKPIAVNGSLATKQPDGSYIFQSAPQTPQQLADAAAKKAAEDRANAALDETKRHNKAMEARPVGGAPVASTSDVALAVQRMKDGTLPPMLPGRATKEYMATMAEAKRQGYDLATAATDWAATQKHIATLNGNQQTRLNQSINALPELLDTVDALAAKWKGGRFPILNRANLAAAKNGAYGDQVATVARQLDSQIADITADLANVYMGGNSPTDHAIELASKSLSGDWSEKVLKDMVALARKNVTIRQNSIRNTGVQGASAGNQYAPAQAAPVAPRTIRARDQRGVLHEAPAGTALPAGWKMEP